MNFHIFTVEISIEGCGMGTRPALYNKFFAKRCKKSLKMLIFGIRRNGQVSGKRCKALKRKCHAQAIYVLKRCNEENMQDPILVYQFIGLGLVLSLFFSEVVGLAAGGMVVPGYMALMIHQPLRVAGTLLTATATFGIIRLLSNFMLIYGRRRTVITILLGFVMGWVSHQLFKFQVGDVALDFQSVGYIIPGLIAIWMERQGVNKTICTLIMAAIMVRLILIIVHGGNLIL